MFVYRRAPRGVAVTCDIDIPAAVHGYTVAIICITRAQKSMPCHCRIDHERKTGVIYSHAKADIAFIEDTEGHIDRYPLSSDDLPGNGGLFAHHAGLECHLQASVPTEADRNVIAKAYVAGRIIASFSLFQTGDRRDTVGAFHDPCRAVFIDQCNTVPEVLVGHCVHRTGFPGVRGRSNRVCAGNRFYRRGTDKADPERVVTGSEVHLTFPESENMAGGGELQDFSVFRNPVTYTMCRQNSHKHHCNKEYLC